MPSTKSVKTALLDVGYEEHGPPDGRPVLLLHGWPDDVRTWDAVAPALAADGHRVLVPYLRGFGPTTFRDAGTTRAGQYTAVAQDAAQFLTAVGVSRAVVVGHDWGGRAGYVMAAAWPERVERLVAISVGHDAIDDPAELPPAQVRQYWYQWFLCHAGGPKAFEKDRRGLCRELWRVWSPALRIDAAAFARTAAAWDNPDWVAVTIQSYRHRWKAAPGDERYADLEELMSRPPTIAVPTTVLHGADDGASLAESSAGQAHLFTGGYRREVLPGVGHFVPRERPEAVVEAVLRGKS